VQRKLYNLSTNNHVWYGRNEAAATLEVLRREVKIDCSSVWFLDDFRDYVYLLDFTSNHAKAFYKAYGLYHGYTNASIEFSNEVNKLKRNIHPLLVNIFNRILDEDIQVNEELDIDELFKDDREYV
jgi:hypothetical protein